MAKAFSIAQARHDLAALVHDLEHQPFVQLTRRGKPVAVLLSLREFQRLTAAHFWDAYSAFRATTDLAKLDIDPNLFNGLRDKSSGREVRW
ncbi:MAG: type II toxin-antitoxin system Phd/YefM family antitoxin [Chloroflexi bacterium]|nr:type II toxin-antitoxin system Phd/YefM family antitoxin [Chloroflexota bacterium]